MLGAFQAVLLREDQDILALATAFREPPAFWWPADRAWFVSTDIDTVSTLVDAPA